MRLHRLDSGTLAYGDCVLVVDGKRRMLIDGGHPGDDRVGGGAPPLQDQIAAILGEAPPFGLDLLVVTHCHSDHIGCLPELYGRGLVQPRNALVADESLGFGHMLGERDEMSTDPLIDQVVAALREEPLASDRTDEELATLISDAANLEQRYAGMLAALERDGVRVVRHGRDDPAELIADAGIAGLAVLGPSQEQLVLCADAIRDFNKEARDAVSAMMQVDALSLYRAVAGSFRADGFLTDSPGKGAALNDQSIVLAVGEPDGRALLSADMQFAKPEVGSSVRLWPSCARRSQPWRRSPSRSCPTTAPTMAPTRTSCESGRSEPLRPAPARVTPRIRAGTRSSSWKTCAAP